MRRGALITLLMLCAAGAPAHASEDPAVSVGNMRFSPADITVTQGDSVTWTFTGPDTNHSVTSDSIGQGSWDSDQNVLSPNHNVGDKFSWYMDIPGDFTYHCKVHPSMTGVVHVLPKPNDPNQPSEDTVAPTFGTPKVHVRKRTVSFTLDEDAQVTAKLTGPGRKRLTMAGKAGPNALSLPSKLRPGRYRLVMRATDAAGNRSIAARVRFRVRG